MLEWIEQPAERHEDPVGVRQPGAQPRECADAHYDVARPADNLEIDYGIGSRNERGGREGLTKLVDIAIVRDLAEEDRGETGRSDQMLIVINRKLDVILVNTIEDVAAPEVAEKGLVAISTDMLLAKDENVVIEVPRQEIANVLRVGMPFAGRARSSGAPRMRRQCRRIRRRADAGE